MLFIKDKYVFAMACLRILSGILEFFAALLMLKLNKVESALKINAVLAAIGPVVLASVMVLGLIGMAGKISLDRFLVITLGVVLIFLGVNR